MTDKQIIIDGVDVSGCSFYEDNPKYRMWETCDCMRTMIDQSGYDELAGAECRGYNCYYKQLNKLQKELQIVDERNKTLEDIEAFRLEELATLDDLRDENNNLKEELEQEKALKETYLACYKAKHNDIEGKLFKLTQILTDIKEIATHCMKQDICTTCNNSDKCHIEDEEIPTYDVCKLILQKINEVEDENNRKI